MTTIGTIEPFFDEIDTIVDEAKIHATEDTLKTRAVDPANVAMADTKLDTNAFGSYQFNADDEEYTLGLDIDRFQQILSQGSSGDSLHLAVNPNTRKLEITIDGSLEFSMALLDPDAIRQEPDIPDLELPASIELEAGALTRGITAADMVSDHVTLGVTADESTFYVAAEGDTDDVRDEMSEDNGLDSLDADLSTTTTDEENEEDEDPSIRSLFSLDYLLDFKSALSPRDDLKLELGDEFPVKVHVDKNDVDHVESLYMLAPRIDAD
jgi:proliferating cell nuclear antigen